MCPTGDRWVRLIVQREDIDSVVFARAEPVLVSFSHFGTEFLVQFLARSGPSVPVNSSEVSRYSTDECSFQDRTVALALIFAEDRIRIAVDRFGIAREADQIVFAIPGNAIRFANEPA